MPDMQQIGPNTWASSTAAVIANASPSASSSSPPRDGDGSSYEPVGPSSIPPWVHVHAPSASAGATPFLAPPPTRPNTRHYKPPQHYRVGRKWDHFRTAEPALLGAPIATRQLEWQPFMQSGPQPVDVRFGASRVGDGGRRRVVDREWLQANMPVVMQGWTEEDELDPEAQAKAPMGFQGVMYKGKWLISPERQERTMKLIWRLLLKNAFVPLVFRIIVLAFSTAALGVGATIYGTVRHVNNDSDPYNQCDPRASTYMAIIVGAVTIPYVGYVTWDEYTSKPLGLRSVAAKTALLLCDLYFIVFSASNVSLAFDALLDNSWACYDTSSLQVGNIRIPTPQTCPNNEDICYKQRALSGVLTVLLVAWLLCFSISVLRVVEKLRPD